MLSLTRTLVTSGHVPLMTQTVFSIANVRRRSYNTGVKTIWNTGINIVPQGSEAIVEFLGKFNRKAQSGVLFAIPILEKIKVVNMMETPLMVDPQTSVTIDNVIVSSSGSLYVKPINSYDICYGSTNPYWSIEQQARSAMRTAIGKITLDQLFRTRAELNNEIYRSLSNTTSNWGLEATRYEITDIGVDGHISDAMNSQAIAERKRRETVLNSQAQRESDINISEGKKQSMINEAEGAKAHDILISEGEKQKAILMAEGEKQRQILIAEGEALALAKLAEIIKSEEGETIYKMRMAEKYMFDLTTGLSKTSNVYIPQDVSDVNKIMSQAMSLYTGLNGNNAKQQ